MRQGANALGAAIHGACSVIAHFIGGSQDLTKRHMRECPQVCEVPIAPDMSLATGDDAGPFITRREVYVRRIMTKEIAIYIFECER